LGSWRPIGVDGLYLGGTLPRRPRHHLHPRLPRPRRPRL